MEIWEEYPEVFHYTKFSTALLIIHSTKLRATRFDRLNDTQEIIYAKNLIAPKLLERFPEATLNDAEHDVENFYKAVMKDASIYITSFCGPTPDTNPYHYNNGILSMWRNYGSDGCSDGGCAIAYKTKNIFNNTRRYRDSLDKFDGALVMDKVIYKNENEDQAHLDRLDRFTDSLSKHLNKQRVDWKEQCTDFLNLMICSKHPAFFEEREVRIGLCFKGNQDETPTDPPQRFHEIPFSPAEDIPRIIIGPHRDQQERFEFLKSYLSTIGLNSIEVTKSEIPLRV